MVCCRLQAVSLTRRRCIAFVFSRYSLTEMHDIKDVVKTDILNGENPDEKKEAAKAVRKAFMARFQEGKNKWFFSKLRF